MHPAGPSELLCVRVLPALVPLVADGVRLRGTQGLPEPLLEETRTGRHGLVVATRRPRARNVEPVPLADEEYLLVAAPAWAERAAALPRAEDLLRRPARGTPGHLRRGRYRRTVFGERHTARAEVTVPNPYAVLSAVAADAGYSVLPRSLCREHLDSGRLAPLHEPEAAPLNALDLVRRPGAETDPDVVRARETHRRATRDR
ncbi:LysR family transcriptional regulator [Streptomyces hygroscopicus subsp. limoneus]|nr:LysR family transcriptional regulator [Streptomyces hygroscopicus subsp. limoneus]